MNRKIPIQLVAGIILILAIILGLLFLANYKKEEVTGNEKNAVKESNNEKGSVLSSLIVNMSPLRTMSIYYDGEEFFLIDNKDGNKSITKLPKIGKFIQSIFNSYPVPDIGLEAFAPEGTIEIFTFKTLDHLLVEILHDTGGIASVSYRTLFTVDLKTKQETKLYTVTESFGNMMEGVTPKPILVTFFDKNDLLFYCSSSSFSGANDLIDPSYRVFSFKDCSKITLVENYTKREENLRGGTEYEYTYSKDKGFIYFDSEGKEIKEKVLSDKYKFANLYTRYIDLIEGKLSVAVGTEVDVWSGGSDRRLFKLDFLQ